MFRRRTVIILLLAALALSACQPAPAAGSYNDRLGVESPAEQAAAASEDQWEGFSPYDTQEVFRTTLTSGAQSMRIEANVDARRRDAYVNLTVGEKRLTLEERESIAQRFFGAGNYACQEEDLSFGLIQYRYHSLNGEEPRALIFDNHGYVDLFEMGDSFAISFDPADALSPQEAEAVEAGSVARVEREGLALLEALDQADWVAAGPYTYFERRGAGRVGAKQVYARGYEGLPVYPAGEIVLNGYTRYADVVNSNIRLFGESICLDNSGESWQARISLAQEQGRAPVTLLPFGQIMATLQDQLAVHPPVVYQNGAMRPVTIGFIQLAYVGVPQPDDQGKISSLEYRLHWVFADEPVYGKYMICVDAVTGDLRWND